jgi:hypothetical protein
VPFPPRRRAVRAPRGQRPVRRHPLPPRRDPLRARADQQPGPGADRRHRRAQDLRLVVEYAQACNIFAQSPDFVGQKLDVLRRHCDTLGRDYDEIEKTILYQSEPDPDAFLAEMRTYATLGVSRVILIPPGGEPRRLDRKTCAPLIRPLAEL